MSRAPEKISAHCVKLQHSVASKTQLVLHITILGFLYWKVSRLHCSISPPPQSYIFTIPSELFRAPNMRTAPELLDFPSTGGSRATVVAFTTHYSPSKLSLRLNPQINLQSFTKKPVALFQIRSSIYTFDADTCIN